MATKLYDLGHGWQAVHELALGDDDRAPISETLTVWRPGKQETAVVLGRDSIDRLRAIFTKVERAA